MGYDITFHPVSNSDIQRYLFDVIDDFSIGHQRARELATDEEDYKMIMEFYYDELKARMDEIREEEKKGLPAVSCWFARTAAALAGFRYPYWYCRGSALSFLASADPALCRLITPITNCGVGVAASFPDSSTGLITANYTASGFFAEPQAIRDHIARLSQPREQTKFFGLRKEPLPSLMDTVFDDEGTDALNRAIDYCERNSLGLIEAADVYCPMAGGGSRYDNLRAAFNGTINKPDA